MYYNLSVCACRYTLLLGLLINTFALADMVKSDAPDLVIFPDDTFNPTKEGVDDVSKLCPIGACDKIPVVYY